MGPATTPLKDQKELDAFKSTKVLSSLPACCSPCCAVGRLLGRAARTLTA